MTADLVSDFDYHPYEPHVRQFRVPRANVLRLDAEAFVSDALFDDVVLRHHVQDVRELEDAAEGGLLSEYELVNARRGLDRLLGLVTRGELVSFLNDVCPFGPSGAGPASPMLRVPLAAVPELQPRHRPTWDPQATP